MYRTAAVHYPSKTLPRSTPIRHRGLSTCVSAAAATAADGGFCGDAVRTPASMAPASTRVTSSLVIINVIK